jgi:hypothetical protein
MKTSAQNISLLARATWLLLIVSVTPAYSTCDVVLRVPRLTISLFQYHGVVDQTRKSYFSQFRGILSETIENLAGRSAQSTRLKDLAKLNLSPAGDATPPEEPADILRTQEYWCNTASLQLLRGNLIPAEAGGYLVRSRVFLGDLKGELPQSTVTLEFPLDAKSYRLASEAHFLLLYYSLAMDYVDHRADGPVVAELLASALDQVGALERNGPLSGDLADVANAVRIAAARYVGRNPP